MSLKLAFEAFRVFIRTERLSVRAGTFLVHMAWVFFVAMLLWCGGFFSQACAAQPPQAALQYRDDVIRNARLEWGLSAPVADFAAQLHQESGCDLMRSRRLALRDWRSSCLPLPTG